MKKHSYGKLINMSWQWMIQILFRPFSLKKWIMLAIIIILAGQMGGSFNINLRGNKADFEKFIESFSKKAPVIPEMTAPFEIPSMPGESEKVTAPRDILPLLDVAPQPPPFLRDPQTVVLVSVVAIAVLLFIGVFILLWMWVNSNFSFVFIDSIIRNDTSLRIPFHRNKAQGNSYFRWNIVFASIALLVFGAIISLPIAQLAKAGVFVAKPPIDAARILSIVLPYVPILIISSILFFLVAFFAREFILPIMYKRKIGILKAWKVFLGFLKRNIGEILLFILVRIGLFILALIAAIILAITGIIILLIIGGLIGLLGWLIYAITPGAAKPVIMAVLVTIAIPTFVFLGFLFTLFFLPIQIFFRIFSIHVLGSIDESLDLFAPKTPEEITAEGDVERYKKSMRLVWFTVLAPILIAIMGLLLAIAIPNFIKVREGALQMRKLGIGRRVPFQKMPVDKRAPHGKTVTVYLKNGNIFEAEIERESEHNIAFRIEGGTFILPRSDILRIEER